jgi:acyl-CoA thioester hydrolase
MFPMQTKSTRTRRIIARAVPEPFVHTVRVRYVECDMQGHVFNGHYLTWFDMAHTELLRAAVGPYQDMVASGIDVVVAESGVRYLAAAHFDDELEIAVELEPPTTSSLTSRFTIRRDGEVITTGFLRHVCVDARTYAKTAWPDDVRAAFAPYVAEYPTRTSPSGILPSRPT